jgi:putative nucleotidyltransferase with HDIG domain
MRLARPIADADGRLIVGSGTLLSGSVVRALRKLALQTVLVVDSGDVAPWERTTPLDEQLRELERRLDREPANEAIAALRLAITRHLCKRALRLDGERRGEAVDDATPPPAAPTTPAPERSEPAAQTPIAGAPGSLDEATLRIRVARLRSVPTLPRLFERVVAALEDPEVDFDHVTQLIEIDQALTAQVLRIANSAFYSTQSTVSRVSEALLMLGTAVTRSIVLSTSVFDPSAVRLRGFFEHSVGCAAAAGALARVTGLGNAEEVAAAGLLHDLGKVVLYKEMPDVFDHIVARATAESRSFRALEHELLGIDHSEIAAWLMERWRFPVVLAEPIVLHHTPARARSARDETAIVHVANILVRALGYGFGGDPTIGSIESAAWARLDLTPAALDRVLDTFDANLDRALNYALFE